MIRFTAIAFTAAALCLTPAVAARAQQQPPPPPPDSLDARAAAIVLAEYRADLTTVQRKLLDLADSIPADRYAWRPTTGVRSVAEVLMHVAGEWYSICPMSLGQQPHADFRPPGPAMRTLEQSSSAKADVLDQLRRSWAHCAAAFATAEPARLTGKYEPARMSLARAALRVAGDQHEHLGQLIAYARSAGVRPSWSR